MSVNTVTLGHTLGSSGPPPKPSLFTATVQFDVGFGVANVQLFAPGSGTGQAMNKQSESGSTQIWTSPQAPVPASGTWTAKATYTVTTAITASGSDTV